MNNRYKFRAWSIKQNRYIWPYPEGFNIIGEVTVFNMLEQSSLSITDYNSLVIEQWTGLIDKNKKPIYEGDIVYIAGKGKCEVYYDLELLGFCFRCLQVERGEEEYEYQDILEDLENVIGNIHEGVK